MVFANEAPICAELEGDQSYYNLHSTSENEQTLRDLLKRPVLVNTVTLGASPDTPLFIDFSGWASMRALFGTAHWDRMLGYVGVRASLVFTAVVSKTAFHQGVVAMCFQHGVLSSDNRFRGRHFPLSVHLPSVRMNLAEETMMQLKVPFIHTEEYFRIQFVGQDAAIYGAFSLVNLTGCRLGPEQTAPNISIYVHMEDVDFIGAAPFDVTFVNTQAGSAPVKASEQSPIVAKAGALIKEARAKKVISRTLDTAATVARYVGYVPGLSAVAGAANWFLSASAKTAGALGFSKPLDQNPITRVVRTQYAFDGQTDVPNPGPVLSPFQSNSLAIDGSLGCNEEDQMALDYVLTKYSYIYRGAFSTDQAVGTAIYTSRVTPSAFWYRDRSLGTVTPTGNISLKSSNTAFENAFYPSTLCYVADNFRYFRGSFVFRVTFAATKLHGGRVLFSFIPFKNVEAPDTPLPLSNVIPVVNAAGPSITGYSKMFDLQDGSTFEFEVPFIYPEQYCSVLSGSIGSVSMVVIAPLKATNSVPSTADFMVEVKAQPGFSFAGVTSSMMAGVPGAGNVAVSFQSGVPVVDINPSASQQCIGEEILSLKTLIQMPDFYRDTLAAGSVTIVTPQPWFKENAPPLAVPMPTTTQSLFYAAKSSRIATMYSFVRGSTNLIVWKAVDDALVATVAFVPDEAGAGATTTSSFYDKQNNPYSVPVVAEGKSSMRVVIPTYARVPRIRSSVRDSAFGGFSAAPAPEVWDNKITSAVPRLVVRNVANTNVAYMIGRAAADDAFCSCFIGPPPVIILNTLAPKPPTYGEGIFL